MNSPNTPVPLPAGVVSTTEELRDALDFRHLTATTLGHYLLQQGQITQDDLDAALLAKAQAPQRRLGEILVERKLLEPHMLTQALSHLLGIPTVHLASLAIEHAAVERLSDKLAHRHHVMPVMMHHNALVLACSQLPDQSALQEIAFQAGTYVMLVLASREDILAAIFLHYDTFTEDLAAAENLIPRNPDHEDNQEKWQDVEYLAKQVPIVRLVGSLINEAIRRRASDIHLHPGTDHVDLLYRMDGTLVPIKQLPKRLLMPVVSRIKILSSLDITERRTPQDGHLKIPYMDQNVDVRVSIIPTSHGESVVLRILNKRVGLRDVHTIGFSAADEERFLDLIHRSSGMLLITGPTGSGKTTTLYAALQEIRHESINVVTVEDPVEYELEGMTQIQLLEQIGFGFPKTLRHILRHDPDVIMIGEVRDAETCGIALEAALTGHLVLSTLHTVDAPSTIIRLQEMGMSPYLIKSAVIGVLGQRLVRLNCPYCRTEETVPAIVRRNLQLSAEEKFYRGAGCDACDNTGFHGRAAIYELFVIDNATRAAISDDMTGADLRALALQSGMRPLIAHGLEYAREGKASLLEVYRSSI
jgi:type IV pilus assembly protein PilB